MKKLSIIIPTYNVEKYIEECLTSLLPQLTDDCELIIVDDCSTDRTVEKINKCLDKFNKHCLLFVQQKNCGVSSSRNKGLEWASGLYVAFIDGDDYVIHTYIQVLLNAIKFGFDYYLISWEAFGDKRETYMANKLPKWNCSVWSRVFKRKIIKVKFDETMCWGEDGKFLKDNINDQMTPGKIMRVIYKYRSGREDSLTNIKKREKSV